MVFSSSTFLFMFLPITLGGYYLLHPGFRNFFLLLASLGFYAFGEPRFVLVMLGSVLFNYLIALIVEKSRKTLTKKIWLAVGILVNLLLLIVFKYLNFLTENLHRVFPSITVSSFVLPIGISFFTFQAMSYVIDVYRGEEAQKNPLNLGLYISFFPQLVAGPIVRYNTIAKEIKNRRINWVDFAEGIERFLNGLIKKIIFANNIAIIADCAFAGEISQNSVLFSWLGALAYTLQIYFDFSGYSDMAIGLGRMFGFHFTKNFDYPYTAKTITEFWRRWHISLSSWFRDYVYIPFGGSRGGKRKHIRNLFVVWTFTGIWHGANWTFIVWGLIYFALLVAEKYIIKPEQNKNKVTAWLYRIIIFLIVMLCWVVFRADNLKVAGCYIKSMFGLYGNRMIDNNWLWYSREYIVLLVFACLLSTPLMRRALAIIKRKTQPVLFDTIKGLIYVFLFIVCISYLVTGAHNPFIYFNF